MNPAAVLAPPSPEAVHKTLAARASEVENLAVRAYSQTLGPRLPSGLALAAVGGFGRKELFPFSDAGLLLLVDSGERTAPAQEALSDFLRLLSDSGLRTSHSIHTVAECAAAGQDDAELTVSLLDRRLLAGDPVVLDRKSTRLNSSHRL